MSPPLPPGNKMGWCHVTCLYLDELRQAKEVDFDKKGQDIIDKMTLTTIPDVLILLHVIFLDSHS